MEDPLKLRAEAVGENFHQSGLDAAQNKTWELVKIISNSIKPGISEKNAIELCDRIFEENGVDKKWHKNRVRFGPNTLHAFKDSSDHEYLLQEDDIYFIDIGPVVDGYEGDAGDSFVLGGDPLKLECAQAARSIFKKCEQEWSSKNLSGRALYEFASSEAKSMGWALNLNLAGHRVSEFPHALHYKGAMAESGFAPSAGIWILEIQIKHPEHNFGAFFEDSLGRITV